MGLCDLQTCSAPPIAGTTVGFTATVIMRHLIFKGREEWEWGNFSPINVTWMGAGLWLSSKKKKKKKVELKTKELS